MGVIIFIIILSVILGLIIYLTDSAPSHEQTQREMAAKVGGSSSGVNTDNLLADVEMMKLKAEVLIQSKAVGDDKTYQAVMNDNYNGPWPEQRGNNYYLSLYDNLRILSIAGINYRQGINRYKGRVMCALVPEPDNEYDPDAIKIVAEDRHHLGYIPTDYTDMVRSMAGGVFPYRCEAHIYEANDEDDKHNFFYGYVYIVQKVKGE